MTKMMHGKVQGLMALGLMATIGCNAPKLVPTSSQQAGSLGVADNGMLFVAAMDNGGVAVVDPSATSGAVKLIATGDHPEKLIVRGNTVFVANRGSRTVTQIDGSSQEVIRQIAVGAEPMGMDTLKDGTLIVANAMSGSVQAIDPDSGATKWTAQLDDQVRAVAALPDGRIFVPSYKNGVMYVIDGKGAVNTQIAMVQPVPETTPTRQLVSVEHILVNPLDDRVYLPHSASLDSPLPPVVTGYYSRPPPTAEFVGGGSAAPIAPAITTLDFQAGALLKATDLKQDFPPPVFTASTSTGGNFAGPKVAALNPSGSFLYVVNQLSNSLSVISTRRGAVDGSYAGQGVLQVIGVGQGPDGIALSRDDRTLYVNNAFDHSISVIVGERDTTRLTELRRITDITPQTLSASQQRGRILFNSASNPRLSQQGFGGVSCASCHPGGREDGHTWHFAEGARNTPALVGRGLASSAPYHWDGALETPESFAHVVQVRMGGSGLNDDEYEDIFNWLESQPAPDNPNRLPDGALTAQQERGRELFYGAAACASCHTPANDLYTDNRDYDVGTAFTTADIDLIASTGIVDPALIHAANPNTPSLRGVFASAPYLHNGTAATLEERIRSNPNGRHGNTAQLSDEDVNALAAFVKTL